MTERGIVLKTIKHGEADLICKVINQRGQLRNLFAPAALKSRKRFGGGTLQPTHFIEYSFQEKSSTELHRCQEAKLIDGFEYLRLNYDRLQLALYFLQLVGRVCREELESPDVFHLLGNGLKSLKVVSDIELLKSHFEIRWLAYQGVLPPSADWTPFLRAPLWEQATFLEMGVARQKIRALIQSLLDQYTG